MKKINVINRNNGLTLIEIIVTIAILGILSSFVFGVFINSFNCTLKSNQKLKATNLAQEYIEKIRICDIKKVFHNYDNKVFYKDDYSIDTDIEDEKLKGINAIRIFVKISKNNSEILSLKTYRKIR